MKIINKKPEETADVSSARGRTAKEFSKLVLSAVVLLLALYIATGLIVDIVVPMISFETEARIFEQSKPPEEETKDPAIKNKFEKAKNILDRLKTGKNVPPLPYTLVLVNHKQPNAFAFPGGRIGLTTGLLNALYDEIEIAFVIGHELGHFNHRDHLRGFGRAAGFGIIMALVFGYSPGAESFGNIVTFTLYRDYSQDREKAADRFGLELVFSVYGKVKGTDRLFKIIDEKRKVPEWAYMFSTHPSPNARIRDLEAFARELTGKGNG